MIVRKTNSQRVPPCSARASRSDSVHHWSDRDKLHQGARHDGVIAAEARHDFGHDLPDQPGVIALVGVNGAVEAFHFIDFRSFHDKGTSRVCQK